MHPAPVSLLPKLVAGLPSTFNQQHPLHPASSGQQINLVGPLPVFCTPPCCQTGLIDAVTASNLTDAFGPDFVGTGEQRSL